MSKTNPRITKKERGLLKGAMRRVFSRSELRQKALAKARVLDYHNEDRPRVKKWSICLECQNMTPEYLLEVDHIEPIVPVDKAFEDMGMDELVNNLWCDERLLQAICKECHSKRTAAQAKIRNLNKKARKQGKKI